MLFLLNFHKMKRWLAALLLLIALPVQAEFTKYHEDDEVVSYLDAASVTRVGREVRMWIIDDYRKPQTDIEGKTYLSMKSQWTYDCAKRLSDVMMAFYHAEAMAQGAEVHSGAVNERQWDKIIPGSVGEAAFKVACRGRK
jgi:hypothetical protein